MSRLDTSIILHASLSRLRSYALSELIDKSEKRVAGWKRNSLLTDGKFILINPNIFINSYFFMLCSFLSWMHYIMNDLLNFME